MSDSSNSSDSACTVVIDLGSSSIKAGFAGDESPRCLEPSIVGRPSAGTEPVMVGADPKRECFGDEALCYCLFLNLTNVLERGVVTHWDTFENQMRHVLMNALRVSPEECDVLVAEPVLNPRAHRERLSQVFFESLDVRRFCVETDSLLCMYSAGRDTGLVVSSGDGLTSVLPIYQGYPIPGAARRLLLGGSDVTNYLTRLLTERGYYFRSSGERQVVQGIKERLARVSYDFNQDMADSCTQWRADSEKEYMLPDCSMITVGSQLFECAECLFQPRTHLGRDHPGIQQLIHSSIQACPTDTRRDLYANVVLSGGNTLLSGIVERIRKEIVNLSPPKSRVKVISPPERKFLPWIGGSILSSLSSFSGWIGRAEYDEWGPSLMHKQCYSLVT